MRFTSDNKILGEMCDFYEKLYTSKDIESDNIDIYLSTLQNITCLSNEERNMCDMFPTLEECEKDVNEMKTNKSPGLMVYQMNFTKHSGKIYKQFL